MRVRDAVRAAPEAQHAAVRRGSHRSDRPFTGRQADGCTRHTRQLGDVGGWRDVEASANPHDGGGAGEALVLATGARHGPLRAPTAGLGTPIVGAGQAGAEQPSRSKRGLRGSVPRPRRRDWAHGDGCLEAAPLCRLPCTCRATRGSRCRQMSGSRRWGRGDGSGRVLRLPRWAPSAACRG
jgi:hypothetical protein